MKLTEEQLAQCRADFEEWMDLELFMLSNFIDDHYVEPRDEFMWRSYKAAWRPVPTVEQIESNLWYYIATDFDGGIIGIGDAAQAIRRAFGGKDE